MDLLPATDKADGGLQVLERATANFTSQVVANTTTLTCLVNHDETASLADSVGNFADRQRVDRTKVNQLD